MAKWIEGPDEVRKVVREHRPGELRKGPVMLSKGFLIVRGRSREIEPIMIGKDGFLCGLKLSFNYDGRSTGCFNFFSSFQKVNILPGVVERAPLVENNIMSRGGCSMGRQP
jgi:hypothetical protein